MNNFSKQKKYILIIAILIIGCFEIYVLNEILHPKVKDLYRLYFIEKKLFSWSHGKGVLYTYNTKITHLKIQNFLSKKGWSNVENNFIWSDGKIASIYFQVDDIKLYEGLLSIQIANKIVESDIKCNLNNQYLETKIIDDVVQFKFNPNILKLEGINELKFEFPNAKKPDIGNGDERFLGIALMSLIIK